MPLWHELFLDDCLFAQDSASSLIIAWATELSWSLFYLADDRSAGKQTFCSCNKNT